jgi:hypothetical protein
MVIPKLKAIIKFAMLVHLKKYLIRDQQQVLAKLLAAKLVQRFWLIIIGVRVIKLFDFKVSE